MYCITYIISAAEDMYSQFSPLGIVLTPDVDPDQSNLHRYGNMPVFHHMSDLPGGYVASADQRLLVCSLFIPLSLKIMKSIHVQNDLIALQGC